MDSHTGKRGPTSSQDNFIMQTSVPVSVTGQWGLSPWKQKVSLNGSLSENGSPLLGRGTWVWPSKFLSFLPFGSWLIPSVHHQEENSQRLASYPDQTASICHPAQGRRGKKQSATDSLYISETTTRGSRSSGRGLALGSETSIDISPLQAKLMQFKQSGEIVKLLMTLCISHTSVTGRLEIWGGLSVHFLGGKKTARNKRFLNTFSNVWKE